jgi:hypothetical protein
MFRLSEYFARARRAAVRQNAIIPASRVAGIAVKRERKGQLACARTSWRRCTTGSNHISAFGVWRNSARREAARINRRGETRWHRLPSRGRQAISGKGCS